MSLMMMIFINDVVSVWVNIPQAGMTRTPFHDLAVDSICLVLLFPNHGVKRWWVHVIPVGWCLHGGT